MQKYKRKPNSERGYTLVEVLVSLSIFTLVSVAAVGVLLVMIDANQKSQNIQSAMSNLSFALDSMTRDIRTGIEYYCDNDGENAAEGNGGGGPNCARESAFGFTEGGASLTNVCSGNKRVAFRLNTVTNQIERDLCADSDGWNWYPLTAENVIVDQLEFTTTGADPLEFGSGTSDTVNPLVTIYIAGTVTGVGNTGSKFEIETTIAQQSLDIE